MEPPLCLHASCVALGGRGLLITGKSGSGKSALALQLMAFGARLVADDRTLVTRDGSVLTARAPDPIRGLVEARGLGLLEADFVAKAGLFACVDLDRQEAERLPQLHEREILGITIPELHRVDAAHFAPGLLQFLKSGQRRI